MSRAISDLEMLREYFKSVLAGANHHANDVDRVIYPLMGFVLQHSDGPIESRMYLGHIVHQLWLRVRGQRYGMSLNHDTRRIEVRAENVQGVVLAVIHNGNTFDELTTIFTSLGSVVPAVA